MGEVWSRKYEVTRNTNEDRGRREEKWEEEVEKGFSLIQYRGFV